MNNEFAYLRHLADKAATGIATSASQEPARAFSMPAGASAILWKQNAINIEIIVVAPNAKLDTTMHKDRDELIRFLGGKLRLTVVEADGTEHVHDLDSTKEVHRHKEIEVAQTATMAGAAGERGCVYMSVSNRKVPDSVYRSLFEDEAMRMWS